MTCRKIHGAPFAALAIYPVEAVSLSGRTGVFRSSASTRRHFCRACGSPAYSRDDESDEIEVPLGSFDEPNAFAPTYELFTSRRETWLGDLPVLRAHYDGNRPGRSRTEP